MAEHLLDAAQVGAALEQVGGEGVAQQVRMDPAGLEPGRCREPAEDQEGARASERAALGVQEQLRPVPAVEERPAAGEVAPERLDGLAADRDDPLLAALAEDADDAVVEVDAALAEPDRLRDPQTGTVEELDERPVSERARRRPGGGLDQPLDLARRERARQPPVRRGSTTAAAGLSARTPISCRCRKNERAAAVRRARVAGASPSARSPAV